MKLEILKAMEKALSSGPSGVLCTVTGKNGSTPCRVGSKMWVYPNGKIEGTIGGGAMEKEAIERSMAMIKNGTAFENMNYRLVSGGKSDIQEGLICGGATSIFLETIGRKREIIIFGAGHVGKCIGKIASFCGYAVKFWDNREGFDSVSIEEATVINSDLEKAISEMTFDSGTYVVICTWGHSKDADVVRLLEHTHPSYIGMLSSRKKAETLWRSLKEKGVSPEHLNRIYTPVGIEIGAGSPEEIAISIMAEIISVDSGTITAKGCPSKT